MALSSSSSPVPNLTSSSMASYASASPSTGYSHSYASSGQGSRSIAGPASPVTRYVVKTSDVIEDLRITVAPESSPSNVIWHTERYLTPNQIILHLIHTPTRAILWSVHRPINTRRQGWYIRLKSPLFPEGMHIPLKPISRTSPYYVEEGCLSFRCRTNTVPAPALRHGYSDSSSSSDSSVHSYPPTPPTMSPIINSRSLRSASEDLLSESIVTTPTRPTIGVPQSRGIVPQSLLASTESTPTVSLSTSPQNPTIDLLSTAPPLQSQTNGKPSLPQLQTQSINQDERGKRRAAPPPALGLPSEITEFILAPMAASSALYPSQEMPFLQASAPAGPTSMLSSLFSKALNLIKSQTSDATSGTSFTLTRIPPARKFAVDPTVSPPPPYASSASLPPSSSSSSHIGLSESPTTPTAASYTSPQIPSTSLAGPRTTALPLAYNHHQQTAISSASLQAPLPPPLLTFTDTTPYLTLHASSGILEVREEEVRVTGVDKAFWVCIALVYWGYMGDREGWVWAGEE